MKIVEVTYLDSGKTERMSKRKFFSLFGKEEGKEILAGYLPNLVAVEIELDTAKKE